MKRGLRYYTPLVTKRSAYSGYYCSTGSPVLDVPQIARLRASGRSKTLSAGAGHASNRMARSVASGPDGRVPVTLAETVARSIEPTQCWTPLPPPRNAKVLPRVTSSVMAKLVPGIFGTSCGATSGVGALVLGLQLRGTPEFGKIRLVELRKIAKEKSENSDDANALTTPLKDAVERR